MGVVSRGAGDEVGHRRIERRTPEVIGDEWNRKNISCFYYYKNLQRVLLLFKNVIPKCFSKDLKTFKVEQGEGKKERRFHLQSVEA